jgi:hypothetical protein
VDEAAASVLGVAAIKISEGDWSIEDKAEGLGNEMEEVQHNTLHSRATRLVTSLRTGLVCS